MKKCFSYRNGLFARQLIGCLLILLVACQKRELEAVDYHALSAVVGIEGKTIEFFKAPEGRDIDIKLFPRLDFAAGTFSQPAVIKLGIQKMSANTLPEAFTAVSSNTCTWTIHSSIAEPEKQYTLVIPFEEPDTELWLENYKSRFRLFKIPSGKETSNRANWLPVENAQLDTVDNTFSALIDNFEYGYCVLFEEIKRDDNISIKTEGAIQIIQAGAADNYFSNTIGKGFYFREGISSFLQDHFWTDDFSIGFTFQGTKPGIYTGNQITVNYKYKKQNNTWLYDFHAVNKTAITISRYEQMGGFVEGKITGPLLTQTGGTIDFTMNFKLIRTR